MNKLLEPYNAILKQIKEDGLYKEERIITTPQSIEIETKDGHSVLNFCANNYLGLSNHPSIINAAKKGLDDYGFGLASVRFICGTQPLHKKLETKISDFFGTEDTILYTSCFDANGGLFETILNEKDAIISDSLNHASMIDGIRLCKAMRLRYNNNDMHSLEEKLKETKNHRLRLIATDGVFSMDGHIAKLDKITMLAEKYNAMVMVDDSHATGFIGNTGRGSGEYHSVMNKIDIFTSTLGKALGGASGGFTTGKKVIIDILRQRSRPYLFSNTVPPAVIAAALEAFDMLSTNTYLRDKLESNTLYFRKKISKLGFDIIDGIHPIIPIMLYDAVLAKKIASRMLKEGIYVIGFNYPVVPKNQARIRIQISASMTKTHLDKALNAFKKVGLDMGIISK
tara:strand:- start:13123 stop:14313 length:1191 start_codon:yes stop_codon:yes gene_type:complete